MCGKRAALSLGLRTIAPARLASLLLSGVVSVVAAQESDGEIRNGLGPTPGCQSTGNASRAREACAPDEPVVTRSEKTFTVTLEPSQRPQCAASLSFEYLQSNTIANVDGTITVEGCPVAAGDYTAIARVRNADGDVQTLEFANAFRRDDDRPLSFHADYPIGEDVELVSLRFRGVRCECSVADDAASPPPDAGSAPPPQ